MSVRLRVAGFVVLTIGLAASSATGQPPPENSVKFDVPAKGAANPDSPAAGVVTAKGEVTVKTGWKCTKVEVTVSEIPALTCSVESLSGVGRSNEV